MNILKHKSWHLYNYDNIERVRRDEENAQKEEEERKRRAAIAEQEARTELLRGKARARTGTQISDQAAPEEPSTHINFFYDEERALLNAEREEKEKLAREEQEAWEKKTGILVGLGQSSTEATGLLPFYTRPRQSLDAVDISEKARRRKDALDPLHDLSKYLVEKERGGKQNALAIAPVAESDEQRRTSSKMKKKKHKKEKRQEKDRHKDKRKQSKEDMLARMREERLARERAERARTDKLLKPHTDHETDSSQKYSSQFNPHIARQNRNKPY